MFMLVMMLFVSDIVWLPVTVAMIGKFLISMTFAIAYLYTAELFPTVIRNAAVGAASTFARIGSMSAPYIVDLLVRTIPNYTITYSVYTNTVSSSHTHTANISKHLQFSHNTQDRFKALNQMCSLA